MKPRSITFHDLKVEISTQNGEVARYYGELKYIIYDKPECEIHCIDDAKYKTDIALKHLIDNLPNAFFQCNRSTIINLHYYKEYDLNKIIMDDRKAFDISTRRMNAFKKKKASLPRISPPCKPCYTCTDDQCSGRASFCIRHKRKES